MNAVSASVMRSWLDVGSNVFHCVWNVIQHAHCAAGVGSRNIIVYIGESAIIIVYTSGGNRHRIASDAC